MPLRARKGNKDIFAFEYDESSWNDLKDIHKNLGLLMPCCNARAIPKTSKLKNYYFSHHKKGDCSSVAESQEHLYLKLIIAKAARDSGWNVKTEWGGESSSGEKWIADVFCEKGKSKVAIEIQLSRQTAEETISRQNRYKDSGVRCAWIASSSTFDISYINESKDIPFFLISKPTVGVVPTVNIFEIDLCNFINSLLSGNVSWVEKPWIYDIEYIKDSCWKCKKENKQVYGFSIGMHEEYAKTVPNASTVLEEIMSIISNKELVAFGLNKIGMFETLKGNAPNFPYCNICFHCNAPQSNYYLLKKMNDDGFDSDFIGAIEYVSKTKSSGKWDFYKSP